MERAEAEAIYDAGRGRCVEVMLELAERSRELAARCEKLRPARLSRGLNGAYLRGFSGA
jgi:hypothetical protein